MSREQELREKVTRFRSDFASLGDGDFKYFYCPMMLVDEDVELCLGHVVNKSIPNSSLVTVPQRKDIDNFYGRVSESCLAPVLRAHSVGADAHSILSDPELRQKLPWSAALNGESVECYEYRGHRDPNHPTLEFRDRNGTSFTIAVKTTNELNDAGQFEIAIDRDFTAEFTASLLKAAHLSLFEVLGYQHVFTAGGLLLADILRTFYLQNKDLPQAQAQNSAQKYFAEHAGMIIPMLGYEPGPLKGTVDDRRFLVCLGASGAWYALGVFVRTNDRMHIVLTPTTHAIDTYFDLTRDFPKREFVYQLIEFTPGDGVEPTHWKAGEKQYRFVPTARVATAV